MKKFVVFSVLLLIISCGSDDLGDTRAYVEGRINSPSSNYENIELSIISESRTVAQTIPTESGSFVLSGPLFSSGFNIKFNKKIKSFLTDKSNCTISTDSLSIVVPEDVSYIKFNEILMKE